MIKVLVCDIDGVLLREDERFSSRYARERGFDVQELTPFFINIFPAALIGDADIRNLLLKHREVWRTDETHVDKLIENWISTHGGVIAENVESINRLRREGVAIYAATNQEKRRGDFIISEFQKGLFDGTYLSADLGHKKPSREFYDIIIKDMIDKNLITHPAQVLIVDDDKENVEGAIEAGMSAKIYDGSQSVYEIVKASDNS